MDTALAYLRVSTINQQEHGHNLDSQLAEIRGYCAKRGYHLGEDGVYRDVVSGAKTDRKGYYELLSRLERGDAQVVVAYEVSRFGRNNLDNAWLIVKAKEHGFRIETVVGGRDFLADPEGELLFDILTAIAKFERQSILMRMTRGKRAAHGRGYWVHSEPPFGYRLEGPRGSKRLVPDPVTAPLVVELFRRRAAGATLIGLAGWLRGQGPFHHASGRPRRWHASTVRAILANPVYQGWLTAWGSTVRGNHVPLAPPEITG